MSTFESRKCSKGCLRDCDDLPCSSREIMEFWHVSSFDCATNYKSPRELPNTPHDPQGIVRDHRPDFELSLGMVLAGPSKFCQYRPPASSLRQSAIHAATQSDNNSVPTSVGGNTLGESNNFPNRLDPIDFILCT